MFKKHIKSYILQSELDNKAVHSLLPFIKTEIRATIKHVANTYMKLVHHKVFLGTVLAIKIKKKSCTLYKLCQINS